MSPESQRIAIAKFEGWKVYDRYADGGIRLWSMHGNGSGCVRTESLPDYLNDLNAIREAFILFRSKDRLQYAIAHRALETIVAIANSADDSKSGMTADATAAQRAEALLRTIGKWTED